MICRDCPYRYSETHPRYPSRRWLFQADPFIVESDAKCIDEGWRDDVMQAAIQWDKKGKP